MADNAALVVKSSAVDPGSAVCPPWCVGEVHLDGHQLHEGTRIEWAGPGQRMRAGASAALSASIALLLENEYEGLQPEIWFGADGDWHELDLPGLEEVIKELENYTVALNALRYRYAAVLASADVASKPLDSAALRLVEITSPCPAWCAYRTEEQHSTCLEDRFHSGPQRTVDLSLHRPEIGLDGAVVADELYVQLEQLAYGHLPTVTITVEGHGGGFGRLSLDEAKWLRSTLGELIAMAEVGATPDALPPIDAVMADMGATVVEDPRLDPKSSGYALGNGTPGGRIWLCVPAGLSPECREQAIRGLLAGVFEGRGRPLWEGNDSLRVIGDRTAMAQASARAAA